MLTRAIRRQLFPLKGSFLSTVPFGSLLSNFTNNYHLPKNLTFPQIKSHFSTFSQSQQDPSPQTETEQQPDLQDIQTRERQLRDIDQEKKAEELFRKQNYRKVDLFHVRESAIHLIHYDSVFLDRICDLFSSLYINKHPKQLENYYLKSKNPRQKIKSNIQTLDEYFNGYFDEYFQKHFPEAVIVKEKDVGNSKELSGQDIIEANEKEIVRLIQEEFRQYNLTRKRKLLSISPNLAKRVDLDVAQEWREAWKLFEEIKTVYKFLDKANIGFLRGDLHSETIFKINKIIEKVQNKDRSNLHGAQFSTQDYRKLFDSVTEFGHFRIPKKGVKHYELQSKNNLYQRQLMVQTVSQQQSFQKFHGAMESLASVHKVHLTGAAKKYIIEWIPQVIEGVKEEQMKCKFRELDEKRLLYAPYMLKINAEKIATVVLSELVGEIMEVIFVGGERETLQADEYYSLTTKKLARKVSGVLSSQFLYEQQQRKFKSIQKLYDYIMNYELKKSSFSVDNITEEELDKLRKLCEHEINLKDLERFMKNLNLFQVEKVVRPEHDIDSDGMVKKLDIKNFLEKRLQYRYVKPQERKTFLNEVINRITKRQGGGRRLSSGEIPQHIQQELGAVLVEIIKNTVKVQNRHGQKTFLLVEEKKIIRQQDMIRTVSLLKINQDFLHKIVPKLEKEGDLFLHQERSVATIVPPLPWIEPEVGGYYLQATNFMRYSQSKLQERMVKYADLKRLYGIINYLGSIPWKINPRVLEVVEQIWSQGGGVGQIPKRYSELISKYTLKLKKERNISKVNQLKKKIQELRDMYTEKCSFVFKLNTARAFAKVKYFYFPHNIDFRGRVYPVPPHLNHMGNDLSRGLLLFGKGQRLGQSGIKWLKIHCANLMGKDKATVPQKLQFIQQNIDFIKSMGRKPLENREWLQNEDCWQSLAAIMQLTQALDSKNPEEYISYLHVHQDGSCNGLQHYAALGRDMEGAYQVNLGVTERPGDVYTHVAKMVIQMLQETIKKENDPNCQLAKKLVGNIKRKTIKQTVMTSVYGVTFIGAREQIYRQLRDQNFLADESECYRASIYITSLTLKAISNLFTGAHHIKKWLIACAKLIGDFNCPVGWTTPLGLPVVQPYRTLSKLDSISTVSQLLTVSTDNEMLPINKNKQKSAFPPNFVHSLDSTHMLYTAEQCQKRNFSFAAVHDSYWTHAGRVQEMNQILRDKFIELHSQPLLERLKESFQKRFPEVSFPEIPQRGEFDLENVRKSVFFFS